MDNATEQRNSDNAPLLVNGIIKVSVDRAENAPLNRADARYLLESPVVLGRRTSKEFEPVHEAWCVDISNKGIGLIVDQKLSSDDYYRLRIPLGGNGKHLFILIRIKRVRCLFGGVYRVGAVFIYDEDKTESEFAEAMRKNREFVSE